MDLQIKIGNFNPQVIVKKGKKIIGQIYKDFELLLNQIPKLEEINGIKLDSIAWHYSPKLEFLSDDGWVYGFEVYFCRNNSMEAKNLWFFRYRKKDEHAIFYFTKNNEWKPFFSDLGLPKDTMKFFLPANKNNKN
jgi:hypothetical protein